MKKFLGNLLVQFYLLNYFFRRKDKVFASSVTSLCQPEILGIETCMMVLLPCPMHPPLQRETRSPLTLNSHLQAPHL